MKYIQPFYARQILFLGYESKHFTLCLDLPGPPCPLERDLGQRMRSCLRLLLSCKFEDWI